MVKNAAGYATHAVAELTLGLALALYRKIVHSAPPLGSELFGKKVGILGGGAIGLEAARLFSAFGCSVSIFNRHPIEPALPFAKQIPLEELLRTSDIVSLHIPLTKETTGFLNKDRLALMKPSAILINTARGAIIDQAALVEALDQKKIAGAALDVLDVEPPFPQNHPLKNRDNVFITPHIGFQTKEALSRRSEIAFKNVKEWLFTL